MARPTTKETLLAAAEAQFDALWKQHDSMSAEMREAAFDFGQDFHGKESHWARDKNLRDVLIHLHEWHGLLIRWITANRGGEAASFLPEPYNWKTYGKMNEVFWEKHQGTSYEMAKKLLVDSHEKVMALIQGFSDEELFVKKHFPWTGNTNLGSYCISSTASHYDWALKKGKQHIKSYNR